MNTRIKEIRKNSGLTQDAFADRISLTRNYISLMEKGERIPSDRTISDICREFGYSEEWLRNGTLPKKPLNKLSTYLGQIDKGNDKFIKELIEVYMELDPDSKKALQIIADKMHEKRKERGQ